MLTLRQSPGSLLVAVIALLALFSHLKHQSQPQAGDNAILQRQEASIENVAEQKVRAVAIPFGTPHHHTTTSTLPSAEEGPAAKAEEPLVRRAPDTLTYDRALCNGRRYWALVQAGNPNAVSPSQADLEDSGWTLRDYPKVISNDLKPVAASLGISSDPADIHRISAQQYSEFTNQNGDREDDVTGAQYLQTYIPASGTIFASENISPEQAIAMYRRDNNLPPYTPAQYRAFTPKFRRWSDLVWFVWAKQAGEEAGNLRYIFRDNVINSDTKGVIDQIFKIPRNTFDQPWPPGPGKTFDVATTDAGKALLGTPHGSGIAWMMADHKDTLGERGLKVTCFTSDGFFKTENNYYMLFELTRP